MKTVFIRAIEASVDDKAAVIRAAVRGWSGTRFEVDQGTFGQVPRSPFAYWTGDAVRACFARYPRFEDSGRIARQGLATADDFRFVRLATEPLPAAQSNRWFPFAKGGAFSPYYADLHLLMDWENDGHRAKAWAGSLYNGSHWSRILKNVDLFLRPGLTWPRRTNGLSFRVMPAGCIFADKGPAAFVEGNDPAELLALCAALNSRAFGALVAVQLARTELAQSFEVGLIQQTPVPDFGAEGANCLAKLALRSWSLRRNLDSRTENSHVFLLPALLQADGAALSDRAQAWVEHAAAIQAELDAFAAEIDDHTYRLYGLSEADRQRIEQGFGVSAEEEESPGERDGKDSDDDGDVAEVDASPMVASLLSWTLGVAFGRFDVRLATGEREAPPEPEPFKPLPVCSAGMLTGGDGLPVAAPPSGYPLTFPPDGILVDDPGHPRDVVLAVRAVFEAVFEDANARWHETAELLGTPDLRSWFARDFFELHIKRYSKSRRKAPIYWQLATASGSYSVWIYVHRATGDTLFRVLNDFVGPKLDHEKAKLDGLTQEAGGNPSAAQRREIEQQETFVGDLQALKTEVARVAPLWKPNLDDGVILNFAPLWRLVPQSRSWQGECKKAWDKLVAGDYDWAHLAMHLWPERVVPKCIDDRSLAIAHGLEDEFWIDDEGGWRQRRGPVDEVAELSVRYASAHAHLLAEAIRLVCEEHAATPARELWSRLEAGELDESRLAKLMWPRRVAERCAGDQQFAARLGLVPPHVGATSREREAWLAAHARSLWDHVVDEVAELFAMQPDTAAVRWAQLESGGLDALRLALRLWPSRVVAKARDDEALAERQGLRGFFWIREERDTWRQLRHPVEEVRLAIARRYSEAVKAALGDLTATVAPTASKGRKSKFRGASPRTPAPKSTPTAARAASVDTTVDEATLRAVKIAIASVTDGASKADVLAVTGLSDGDWNKAITALLDRGDVTRTGQKRGTRYHAEES